MTRRDAPQLMRRLPAIQRLAVRAWMDAFDIGEEQLTLPLLRVLAGAAAAEDEGVRSLLAALLEQERLQLSQFEGGGPGVAAGRAGVY
jgi:hypothetical protein